ncbi:hypothetical protein SAMN05216389_109130 [Oceanobacillus limi]|uniref:DUF4129 domain-containing protein n=1 Tax=Oceanobacillus limi TaxID=930131 RepID=A0A1I0DTQ5_9BACI|nr:hypothetical protein [Oceanobacillus limi]SET35345.1 hypothetical protein SAMN05216389_109130 [Oceanobacillus limi]
MNKNFIITHAYHFLSEAILTFLFILPVMYFHYQVTPYWVYLGIVIGIAIVFSSYAWLKWKQLPYILTAPIIFIVFYTIGYPIGLSLAFAGLLTWRYIAIRSEMHINRENLYIIMSILLGTGIMIFVRDGQALMLVFVQLLIVMIGNISSHAAKIGKGDKKDFNRQFWGGFLGFFLAITTLIYLFSDEIRTLFIRSYQVITNGFIEMVTSLASEVVPDIELGDFVEYSDNEQQLDTMEEAELGESIFNEVSLFGSIYIIITGIIICLVLIMLVLFIKSRFTFKEPEEEKKVDYHKTEEKLTRYKSHERRLYRKRMKKIDHPVRKMIYRFEHLAAKHGKGRHPFETIEEWLSRIGYSVDLYVYQKVRYGCMEVNEKEIVQLKQSLEQIENHFNS